MSKGGGKTNTVTQSTQLPGWIQNAAQANLATAQNLAAQPYQQYPGPTLAPFTPAQNAAFNTITGAVGATQPLYSTAENMVANLPQTTQQFESPYLGQVESDVTSNLQRQGALNAQTIAGNAVGANAFGGTRQGVQTALNASETQRNIGQAVDTIQQQGWNTAMNAALSAAPQLANIAGAGQNALLQGAGAELGVGNQQQGQTQAGYAQALSNWNAAMGWPYQQLGVMESALTSTPYGGSTTATQPYNQNTAANLLGTAAAAMPLANSLYNAGSSAYNSIFGPTTSTGAWLDTSGGLSGAGTTGIGDTGWLTSAGTAPDASWFGNFGGSSAADAAASAY